MRSTYSAVSGLLVAVVLATFAGPAAADSPRGYYVLAVGVGKYKADEIPSLPSDQGRRTSSPSCSRASVSQRKPRVLSNEDATTTCGSRRPCGR